MSESTIMIELLYNDQSWDLKIPALVTPARLTQLITLNLAQLGVRLPKKWTLKVSGKQIVMDNKIILANYPISTGDRLLVEEMNMEAENGTAE